MPTQSSSYEDSGCWRAAALISTLYFLLLAGRDGSSCWLTAVDGCSKEIRTCTSSWYPADTGTITTLSLRQNDVATPFWHNDDATITSCVHSVQRRSVITRTIFSQNRYPKLDHEVWVSFANSNAHLFENWYNLQQISEPVNTNKLYNWPGVRIWRAINCSQSWLRPVSYFAVTVLYAISYYIALCYTTL